MNHFGRVSVCGAISSYNDAVKPKGKSQKLSFGAECIQLDIFSQLKL